ncbi:phosphatidylserine decarboxylase [Bacillus sp. FJAT-45350]|uniref:phosphatidylserine decarboxylase n=1 Tax=Bacillus sp. FJAT-45350 TaxID=2011014 RepID=UPI000BB71A9B|nr:phosphatidylserine decarboxylase [Bacillus sp. FJAT-45350]
MKKALYRSFMELTSNQLNSYLLRKFTTSSASRYLVKSFAKTYKINQEEMEKPLSDYRSLHSFFVRRLKQGVRIIDERKDQVVSPVDGILADLGEITDTCTFFVKGQTYSIEEMLGNHNHIDKYRGGAYVIFYLSPSHYHRIHSPISGQVIRQWTLGKKSYPVNEHGLIYGKRPLSRNYRLITEVQTEGKHMAIVKVGALNVNSIHTTHPSSEIKKGEEVGYFSFGSTVVLLFEKGIFHSDEKNLPKEVQVGQSIGRIEFSN